MNRTFILNARYFGIKLAIFNTLHIITYHYPRTSICHFVNKNRHKFVKKYLLNEFSEFLINFKSSLPDISKQIGRKSEENIIWQCWWQGEEFLEGITKVCVDSVRKNFKSYKVVLITKDNYYKYVFLPKHIISKMENGEISLTVFSDILRTSLLKQNGGLWIDVTVYITEKIKDRYLNLDFFSCKETSKDNFYVSNYRWSTFCFGGNKEHVVFDFISQFFYEYWKTKNILIDYYLFDYIIDIGYDNIESIKVAIDNVPITNPSKHLLQEYLNKPYDSMLFESLKTNTMFFKLSRKANYENILEDGKISFWGYLMDN
ncbi:capsular polysaccharide synthesis protein [Labilibacter marinus]|uniref:capsular polysaccharide synthesis protein n=1 Tax=Labilibacter marinus TaxID=1477105 RepID=UPI0021D11F3B|nr:capsular polysaccharide synthesis protein [Labilibacter marinus]